MEKKFDYDIIILYGPPWDQAAKLSKHHFAHEWAKSKKVLYVEAPMNPISFITRRKEALKLWARFRNGPQEVSKNLWVTTFFYPLPYRGSRFLFGSKLVNKFNQNFVKNKLIKQIFNLNLINPILVIGSAHILPIISDLKSSKIIYHCSDDYTLVPSFPKSFNKIEEELIKKCDLVVTTAEELKKAKIHLNSNTISIPNGANIKHFAKTQNKNIIIPDDIRNIPKPVIGYIGTVFRWLDQDWVEYAANKNKSFNFVFIGPITTDISKISKLKNVHFLGPKPYENLPNYLKYFSVATIPFVIDGVTLKASPIKFYEYLASGIPIVSTRLPDLFEFNEVTLLVSNKEEFNNAICKILKDKDKSKELRMEISKNYSWTSRFNQLNNFIDNLD